MGWRRSVFNYSSNESSNEIDCVFDFSNDSDIDGSTESSLQNDDVAISDYSSHEDGYETGSDQEEENTAKSLDDITQVPEMEFANGEEEQTVPQRDNPEPSRDRHNPNRIFAGVSLPSRISRPSVRISRQQLKIFLFEMRQIRNRSKVLWILARLLMCRRHFHIQSSFLRLPSWKLKVSKNVQ